MIVAIDFDNIDEAIDFIDGFQPGKRDKVSAHFPNEGYILQEDLPRFCEEMRDVWTYSMKDDMPDAETEVTAEFIHEYQEEPFEIQTRFSATREW